MKEHFLLLLMALCSIALQWRQVRLPLHPDTGQFLYKAFLENRGERFAPARLLKTPPFFSGSYLPVWHKFFVYKTLEIFYFLFRPRVKDFRILYAIYNLGTLYMVYLVGSELFNPKIGLWSALFYGLYSLVPYTDNYQIHAEHYGLLPHLSSLLLIVKGTHTHNQLLLFFAGIIIGAVLLYKVVFLIEGLWFLSLPMLFFSQGGYTLIIIYGLITSFIIYLIIFSSTRRLSYFLSLFNPKFFFHYRNTSYVERNYLTNIFKKIFLQFQKIIRMVGQLCVPIFLSSLFFAHTSLSPNTKEELFLLLWFLIAILIIIIQNKYYLSHLMPLIPIASIISSISLMHLFIKPDRWNTYTLIMGSILGGLGIINWLSLWNYFFIFSPLQYHLSYYKGLNNPNTLRFLAAEVIASYIKANSSPKDRILQWGYNCELYVLAERRAALGNLEFSLITDPKIADPYFGRVWREWIINAVSSQRPKYVVDMDGSLNIGVLEEASGLRYRLVKNFYSMFPVYELINVISIMGREEVDIAQLSTHKLTIPVNGKVMSQREFNDYVAFCINEGEWNKGNEITGNGVANLLNDWSSIHCGKLYAIWNIKVEGAET